MIARQRLGRRTEARNVPASDGTPGPLASWRLTFLIVHPISLVFRGCTLANVNGPEPIVRLFPGRLDNRMEMDG